MMVNPITPQRAAVLAVLQQAGKPMRLTDIAAAVQMKRNTVAHMLLRMRTDGQVEQAAWGQWQARLTAHSA